MKIINILYTACIIFLFAAQNLFAQDPDPNSFFPYSVGNVWEYDTPAGVGRYEIMRDSIGSDDLIYLFYGSIFFDPIFGIDTSTAVVYRYPTDLKWEWYHLDADSGDTWMVYPEDTINGIQRREALVYNTYLWFIFGQPTEFKDIEYYDLNWGDTVINEFAWKINTETLASGFGLIEDFSEEPPHIEKLIRGCVIEGDTFGIVTTVEEDVQLPEDFYLSQNFPNPFNPSTNIKYAISSRQFVSLKVYNVLGNEVAVLVNEEKPAGQYKVSFNGAGLASGIYVYRLTSGSFTSTKKLILLK